MAWRPYGNLIDGELDNSVLEKVTGWIRFFRSGKKPLKVTLDLEGDFHDDIRGKVIRLRNETPFDKNTEEDLEGTYMEDFAPVQRGRVGDMTAGLSLGPWTPKIAKRLMAQHQAYWDDNGIRGAEREKHQRHFAKKYRKHIEAGDLFYPYSSYPYLEWYSEANGRVVLELDPSQVEVVGGAVSVKAKTVAEHVADRRKRAQEMEDFMKGLLKQFSQENRDKGGDANVIGAVVS
jgi:hypothetical protein